MKTKTLNGFCMGAVVAIMALVLATMMVPAIAFAADDTNKTVVADATEKDVAVEVGNVTTYGNPGVKAKAADEHTATVETGDISTDGGQGIIADAASLGNVNITTGDITSTSDSGIEAWTEGEATISINTGNVSAGEHGDGIALYAPNTDIINPARITVEAGDVSAGERGLVVRPYSNANISVVVGNVKAKGDGMEIVTESGATSAISANDVESGHYGMFVYVSEGSQVDALVTGTLSGAKAPVSFMGALFNDPDRFKLTAWQIKMNDNAIAMVEGVNSDVAEQATSTEADTNADAASSFEKSILYIMQLVQPSVGAKLSATYADGTPLSTSHDYPVAKEGEKVLLKIDLEEGYQVLGAYNGKDEQTELLMDENGNYYLVVPKGGGVYLSVVLEQDGVISIVDITDEGGESNDAPETKATSPSTSPKATGETMPKTGDNTLTPLFLALALLSATTLALASAKRYGRTQ